MNNHCSCSVWTALVLGLAAPVVLAEAISGIRVETPRDFGYTLGDRIRHEMHLSLSDPYRLDTTTLPDTGRLNRWLEISTAQWDAEFGDEAVSYRIVIDYQIFNAPEQLAYVTIPQQEFLITGGSNPIPVFAPEWTFSIGPVTNADARAILALRPDRKPHAIPVDGRRIRLTIWNLLLAGTLFYLAWTQWILPRLERRHYPFSDAYRKLKRLRRADPSAENYRLALQAFHAAINETANRVVFSGTLNGFLAGNASYAELNTELGALFDRSREVFFDEREIAEPETAMRELIELCKQCRSLERSTA